MDIENLKEILASLSTDDKQNLAVSIQLIEEIQSSRKFCLFKNISLFQFIYLCLKFFDSFRSK